MRPLNGETIIIDSREQKKWPFQNVKVETAKLDTGDYSLKGYEDRITIERKSKVDLIQSVTHSRVRFEKEMQRLEKIEYACVVIECNLKDLWIRPPHMPRVNMMSVVNTACQWSAKYKVPFFFCSDRVHARHFAINYFQGFIKKEIGGK